jgi:hypothetical protein
MHTQPWTLSQAYTPSSVMHALFYSFYCQSAALDPSQAHIKLADFGLSVALPNKHVQEVARSTEPPGRCDQGNLCGGWGGLLVCLFVKGKEVMKGLLCAVAQAHEPSPSGMRCSEWHQTGGCVNI